MGLIYRYFQITQDNKTFNPPVLLHDYSVTNRNKPKDEIVQIYVKDNPEIEYIDFIDKPFLLVSEEFKRVAMMYNGELDCHAVALTEKETQTVYWHIDLPAVDCFPRSKSVAHTDKTVDISKTGGLSFFKYQLAQHLLPLYIIRLDLAESVIRRGLTGFRLTGLEHSS